MAITGRIRCREIVLRPVLRPVHSSARTSPVIPAASIILRSLAPSPMAMTCSRFNPSSSRTLFNTAALPCAPMISPKTLPVSFPSCISARVGEARWRQPDRPHHRSGFSAKKCKPAGASSRILCRSPTRFCFRGPPGFAGRIRPGSDGHGLDPVGDRIH